MKLLLDAQQQAGEARWQAAACLRNSRDCVMHSCLIAPTACLAVHQLAPIRTCVFKCCSAARL